METNKQPIKKPFYKKWWFIVLVVIIVLAGIGGALGDDGSDAQKNDSEPVASNIDSNSQEDSVQEESEQEDVAQEEPEQDTASLGEKNALGTAENYLYMGGFSKKRLKEQLDFEGYSSSEIDYAIENCSADWKQQAAICAENYLNTSSFSKQRLKEQLAYEGFTDKQISYALESVGY